MICLWFVWSNSRSQEMKGDNYIGGDSMIRLKIKKFDFI
jgi:hypothetical protein